MDEIEKLFTNEDYTSSREDVQNKLMDAIDFLRSACTKFLDIVKCGQENYPTDLDTKRFHLILREMVTEFSIRKINDKFYYFLRVKSKRKLN